MDLSRSPPAEEASASSASVHCGGLTAAFRFVLLSGSIFTTESDVKSDSQLEIDSGDVALVKSVILMTGSGIVISLLLLQVKLCRQKYSIPTIIKTVITPDIDHVTFLVKPDFLCSMCS